MTADTPSRKPRTTMGELATILAERRSAATAYVNVKVSAQGALQPDVNVTPDTTETDIDEMTRLALRSVAAIMASVNGGEPEPKKAPRKPAKKDEFGEVLF